MRNPRKRRRVYRFRAGKYKLWRRVGLAVCAIILAVSLWQLCSYASQYVRSVRLSAELRETYLSTAEEATQQPPIPTSSQSSTEGPAQTQTTDAAPPAETPVATPDPLGTPVPKAYPNNPYRLIGERFQKLRRQNEDIVGWLNIDGVISEAVVQRDNTYYLRRDYRGYHNDNGAIFLDEACSLRNRPYTLTLYGHNMKTGAMFGSLRNYENIGFYRKNPFVDFDTIYEEGRYVIFSVAEVSIDVKSPHYSGFYRLESCTNLEREAIIKRLCEMSKHTCAIDVSAEDQLLLLVTCVGDDEDRRVVAARRLREDETEEALLQRVQLAR